MINPIEFYTELGTKAAEARNQKGEARASFHARHFRDARALESGKRGRRRTRLTTTLTLPQGMHQKWSISDDTL